MAFVLLGNHNDIVAVSRISTDPDNIEGEFAIVVRADHQNSGIGHMLLEKLIDYSRIRGVSRVIGFVLARNTKMLALARDLAFRSGQPDEAGVIKVTLDLQC